LFEEDHFIYEKIGKDDNGYIDDAIGDQHGSQQGPWFLEQGDDAFPGKVLFCLQDIDILKSKGKKGNFGTGKHKRKDQQEKDDDSEDSGSLGIDDQQPC